MGIGSPELLAKFRPPNFPGSYMVSFEGVEGAGKSSQILRTEAFLEEQGFRVTVLREPGGTPFGEQLRKVVLDSRVPLHPVAEMYLFASSRAQLLSEVTLQELGQPGTVVIYDRYIDSSLAYQGSGGKLGVETILECHQHFPLNIVPNITFYLKIDLETSYSRQEKRSNPKDYFESQGNDFYNSTVEGYELASKLFPNRIEVIDGSGDLDQVFSLLKPKLEELIRR